jgi:hypothetical protein
MGYGQKEDFKAATAIVKSINTSLSIARRGLVAVLLLLPQKNGVLENGLGHFKPP